MIARRPSGGDVRGATPAHPLLFPVGHQDASLSQSPQQQLLDQRYIQRMFAAGALGGLWLPEPQYLYEDSAGTLGASNDGVCGLWLDCSRDLVLGSELVSNSGGPFVGVDNWTASSYQGATASLSIVSGYLRVTGNAVTTGNSYGSFILNTVPGTWYKVYVSGITGSHSPFIRVTNSGTTTTLVERGGGATISIIFYATGTAHAVHFNVGANVVNGWAQISSATVQAFYGTHALQATLANKPTLRRTPVSGKYWLDSNNINATGAMTATFPSSLGSACTIARANADGVTITPNQTITTTYNLTPPYGYNSAVMIINRALTASETAVVSRYLRGWTPIYSNGVTL